MRRTLLSLGLAITATLSAQAQSPTGPAAMLGTPRASLALPVPARDSGFVRAAHSEPIQPNLGAPSGPAFSPYGLINPQPNPANVKMEPPLAQGGSAAPLPPPVDYEDPLIAMPANTLPGALNSNRLRLSAEYLMWWTNGFNVPALLTTGPAIGNGIIGAPGVATLFGNQAVSSGFHSGIRTGFEWWFGPCQQWAFDGHIFGLAQQGNSARFASAGDPLLARPFVNLNTGTNSAEIVAFPGLFAGGVAIGNSTSLWGADINLRRKICEGCSSYLDGLVGYRFVNLTEELKIAESSSRLTPVTPNPANPSTFIVSGTSFDRFRTSNQFNGAQIGAAMGCVRGRWTLDLRTMVALGVMASTVQIDGAQTVQRIDGATVTTPGGLLALNSNIGRYERDRFAVVPELTFNLGYNVSDRCRVFVGYNVLYLSSVMRPGDQIDPGLDVNRIPNFPTNPNAVPAPRPTVPLKDTSFIAQGINLGFMMKW